MRSFTTRANREDLDFLGGNEASAEEVLVDQLAEHFEHCERAGVEPDEKANDAAIGPGELGVRGAIAHYEGLNADARAEANKRSLDARRAVLKQFLDAPHISNYSQEQGEEHAP